MQVPRIEVALAPHARARHASLRVLSLVAAIFATTVLAGIIAVMLFAPTL